jgi:hypothetical protein
MSDDPKDKMEQQSQDVSKLSEDSSSKVKRRGRPSKKPTSTTPEDSVKVKSSSKSRRTRKSKPSSEPSQSEISLSKLPQIEPVSSEPVLSEPTLKKGVRGRSRKSKQESISDLSPAEQSPAELPVPELDSEGSIPKQRSDGSILFTSDDLNSSELEKGSEKSSTGESGSSREPKKRRS